MKISINKENVGADSSAFKYILFLSGFTYPTAILFSVIYIMFLVHMKREPTDMEFLIPPMFIMYLFLSPMYVFYKTYRYYFALMAIGERFHEKKKLVDGIIRKSKKMLKIFNVFGVSLFLFSFYRFYGCSTFVFVGFFMSLFLIVSSFAIRVQIEAMGIKGVMNKF